jgi:hypothetical protein
MLKWWLTVDHRVSIERQTYLGCPRTTALQKPFDISPYADIQHKDSYLSNAVHSAQIKDSVTKPFNPIARMAAT